MRALLGVVLLFLTSAASAGEFHVAPTGSDTNPGTQEKPFATLRQARDAVRALKGHNRPAEPMNVHVADGTYTITEPLVLQPIDSGTEQAPVVYRAAPGAHPVVSGGRAITGWQPGEKGIWKTQLPEVAAGRWYFEQIFVNGHRATRARTPNKFFYYLQDIREEPLGAGKAAAKGPRDRARQTVRMRQEDARQAFAGLRPEDARDVNLVVYHNWDNTRRFLDNIDAEHGILVSTGKSMKPWNPWRRNSHYILENYLAALDAPGEWFLSRDGTLYYMPLPGEDMTKAEVFAPVAEKFLVIAGAPAAGEFVEHVAIQGLAFRHGQWLTPRSGCEPQQAAAYLEASVVADGARHVTFENCEIGHVGAYAIWFRKGCRDCAIRHSYIHDFGAGGIRIGEHGIARNEAERTGHITVDNNIVRDGGSIFPCAVGVLVAQSGDNQVTHNEIANLFYTAISAGWTWGYHENLAKRNTIAFNHVHHLGWWLMSDMGGIYTLGPSEGTVVANNVFHDIYSFSYGGWGMYTDEGSTGEIFENNLVYNTKTGSFHQHYGKENILRNNILAFSQEQQIQATRVEDHLSFTLENNLVYWDTGKLLAGPWDKLRFVSRKNLFWQSAGRPVDFAGKSLAQWQAKGHEQGSLVADPQFVDPAHGDYHLSLDSPALKLGFKPFEYSKAGVYGDAAWVAKSHDVKYPAMEEPPASGPLEIHEDFEDQPVGRRPSGMLSHVENRGDAIVVTDETAAGGKRCLKIVGAPGLAKSYNPHLTFENLGYPSGKVHNSFDLKIAKDSRFHFEWRDYSVAEYATGADFAVRDGQLTVGKAAKVALPAEPWIHFDIVGTLNGPKAGWTLRVTVPDRPPCEFRNLHWTNPRFRQLGWIGFTSNAPYKTTFYLDNVELTPVKRN
jgi:hypothetical protein